MRKRRILSLLLAVAVMATMLVAVPLTASAAEDTVSISYKVVPPDSATSYKAKDALLDNNDLYVTVFGEVTPTADAQTYTDGDTVINFTHYITARSSIDLTEKKEDLFSAITPPSGKSPIYIKAKKAGTLTIYCFSNAIAKDFHLFGNKEGKDVATLSSTDNNSKKVYAITAKVAKDGEYVAYLKSSDAMRFMGLDFKADSVVITQTSTLTIEGANSIYIGQRIPLTATQDEGANEEIEWKVIEGEGNAEVDQSGNVTGKAAGTAKIQATATTSNTSATHDITVNKRDAVTELTLDREKADVYVGKDINLTASIKPESMQQYYKVEWSAEGTGEPKGEATVSDGKVTGKKAGEVTITAKVTDDEEKPHEATCTVTVKDIPKLDGGVSFTDESDMKNKLVAAKETKTYDLLKDAENIGYSTETDGAALDGESPYEAKNLYYSNEIGIACASANLYYNGKSSFDIDQISHKNGIRLKHGQDEFALKLAPGSTVRVCVNGANSGRYGTIGTKTGITDQNASEVLAKTYELGSSPGLMAHTNNTGAEEVVYISATGDSFISQIQVVVAPKFGDGIADSGYYTVDPDTNEGAIRFLQSFSDNTAVKKFGFLIINGGTGEFEPSITADTATEVASEDTAKIGQIASAGGFYADVTGITYESSDKYYAKAFVVIDDGTEAGYTVISEATIKGEVNWQRPIEKPESANQ